MLDTTLRGEIEIERQGMGKGDGQRQRVKERWQGRFEAGGRELRLVGGS